jgi:TPR repeat protein
VLWWCLVDPLLTRASSFEATPPIRAAREWFQKAANAGDPAAMDRLGWLLATSDPPELEGVRCLFEKAAEAGYAHAMFNLGLLLEGSHPPNGTRLACGTRAADAGEVDAMLNLGALLQQLDPPEVDAARDSYRRAADAGDPDAMCNRGFLLETSDQPYLEAARDWFQRAARSGHSEAKLHLQVDDKALSPSAEHVLRRQLESQESKPLNGLLSECARYFRAIARTTSIHQDEKSELVRGNAWFCRVGPPRRRGRNLSPWRSPRRRDPRVLTVALCSCLSLDASGRQAGDKPLGHEEVEQDDG